MPQKNDEDLDLKSTEESSKASDKIETPRSKVEKENSADSFDSEDLEDDVEDSDDSAEDYLDEDEEDDEKPESAKSGLHNSLTSERLVLVVDEAGLRRDETVEIVKQVLPNSQIEVADNPNEAQEKLDATPYDTCVVNFLMPGFSSSDFVKNVANHPRNPLLVGFSADKMSDAYDPKKGIKIKPLRRIFEIETISEDSDDDMDYEEE